ncbi:hypothetical protein B0T16DRAFT_178840 [Cercophora newfieldiana]|uniref:Uncharacterized protein n=1 Tax=Cercophora newfieldiana TaxID=92897 RepID=A0AA39XZN5_9PEZI|nr:hypothetical protein B0T16DRAFT_178840 [Cercophora newfieldiana]
MASLRLQFNGLGPVGRAVGTCGVTRSGSAGRRGWCLSITDGPRSFMVFAYGPDSGCLWSRIRPLKVSSQRCLFV